VGKRAVGEETDRGERESGWEENDRGERKERMTAGPHQQVVGIEDEYRVWMSAGEISLEERILLTRTKYSF
jgi:hypothetical protein